jgi:DNA repair protein RecN (Recombination protein N)
MHRALVDAYGGLEMPARGAESAFHRLREAERALETERARVAAAEGEAEFARHAHEELSRLAVQAGEEEALASRRQAMMQGEKVAADIREARHHLTGDGAILPVLLSVSRRLQRRMPQAPSLIEPSVKALDEAIEALEGATRAVEDAMEACAFDPQELERCEERLFALRAMGRKYAAPIEALPVLAQKYADDLAALEAGRSEVTRLKTKAAGARAAYEAGATALSSAREQSARALERAVMTELPPLRLERAEFCADISRDDALVSATGYDRVQFLVRTNPGSRLGPLMKVASGGELARFLLAIKVCLAERGTAPTLVFDEIDTGVGGAVADAMGQRLARLSSRAQVLAVTHAPQVAARAQNHYRIVKSDVGAGERVVTRVARLGANDRREEIARMLAGAEITREARAAAVSLIEKAE